MMNNSGANKQYINPVRLVWLVCLIGLAAGIAMMIVVWQADNNIRREHKNFNILKTNVTERAALLGKSLEQINQKVHKLLEGKIFQAAKPDQTRLLTLVAQYKELVKSPEADDLFKRLEAKIIQLISLHDKCTEWAEKHRTISEKIPSANHEQAATIGKIKQTAHRAEGVQRLNKALLVRDYETTNKEKSSAIIQQLISDIKTTTNLTTIHQDITDLALRAEHVSGTKTLEELIDLQDNRILPILSRLHYSGFFSEQEAPGLKQPFPFTLLVDFERALFGKGYKLDLAHQTVIPGTDGLLVLQAENLRLSAEADMLLLESNKIEDNIQAIFTSIADSAETLIAEKGLKAEKSLAWAQSAMLLLLFGTAAFFLFFSSKIIKAGKVQILLIERTNQKLDTRTRELARSETTLKGILRAVPTGIGLVRKRKFVWTNKQFQQMTGFSEAELNGNMVRSVYPSDEEFKKLGEMYRQFKGLETITTETVLRRRDGSTFNVVLSWTALEPHNIHAGIVFTALDITKRKEAEDRIREQNDFLFSITESLTYPFYVIDADNYVVAMANSTAAKNRDWHGSPCYSHIFGRETPCGPEMTCPLDRVKASGKAVVVEQTHRDEDGNPHYHQVHCYPIFNKQGRISQVIEYSIDITENKKMEQDIIKAKKLAATEILAGGIAHDFNNILTVIIGALELVKMDISPGTQTAEILDGATTASYKAKNLVGKFLSLSKAGRPVKKCVDLKQLLLDSIAEKLIDHQIKYTFSYPDDLLKIDVDVEQIHEALSNIYQNAREAMGEDGLLRISVTTLEAIPLAPDQAGISGKEEKYAKINIEDNGRGIAEKDLPYIFDPYFSSKPLGNQKGMGLGLTIVYSIIDKHNGDVEVSSSPGIGTTVSIYLPLSEQNK